MKNLFILAAAFLTVTCANAAVPTSDVEHIACDAGFKAGLSSDVVGGFYLSSNGCDVILKEDGIQGSGPESVHSFVTVLVRGSLKIGKGQGNYLGQYRVPVLNNGDYGAVKTIKKAELE